MEFHHQQFKVVLLLSTFNTQVNLLGLMSGTLFKPTNSNFYLPYFVLWAIC